MRDAKCKLFLQILSNLRYFHLHSASSCNDPPGPYSSALSEMSFSWPSFPKFSVIIRITVGAQHSPKHITHNDVFRYGDAPRTLRGTHNIAFTLFG